VDKDAIIDVIKRYPIATLGFLVALIAIIVIFVRGDLSTPLEAREVELNSEINVLEANAKNAIGLEADIEELESLVEVVEGRLFDADQRAINTNFFYRLEGLAEIQMKGVNSVPGADPALDKKGPNELKLFDHLLYDLAVEGTYPEIVSFVEKVEQVSAFLRVTSLQIVPSASTLSNAGGNNQKNNAGLTYLARIRVVVLTEKGS